MNDADGGGIYNYGQLVMIGSGLTNNSAAGGAGGGLFNEGSAALTAPWSASTEAPTREAS